jgi:hypothetical protein
MGLWVGDGHHSYRMAPPFRLEASANMLTGMTAGRVLVLTLNPAGSRGDFAGWYNILDARIKTCFVVWV